MPFRGRKAPCPALALLALCAAWMQATCGARAQDTGVRPTLVISRQRTWGYDQTGSARVGSFELRNSPRLRLDDTLRAVPGFSLFRRGGSLSAQPTTQGVSLRGIAPSGSGRSLILLDGIPQNDPFGGWVYWSRIPARGVSSVELSPGPRPGPFGGSAMAGTVRIESESPAGKPGAGGSASASIGGRRTFDGELSGELSGERGEWMDLRMTRFETEGDYLIADGFRGRVDIPAWAQSRTFDLRASIPAGEGLRFRSTLGVFEDLRGNGTPLTGSAARGADVTLALERPGSPGAPPAWRLAAFAQTRQFESTFSSVSPARDFEAPSLDQFDVPATALGLGWEVNGELGDHLRVRSGVDARYLQGETNERFRHIDGRYTAVRQAGGSQVIGGGFAGVTHESGAVRNQLSARLDFWQNGDARRIERPIEPAGGFAGRALYPEDATGLLPALRWDATWQIAPPAALSAAAYAGGRVPTLNELHRPFRVRDELTESNPALDPEELRGIELGIDIQPSRGFKASSRPFYNELRDGVGNVTLGRGPFLSETFGFIPEGTTLRQKRNIPLIEIRGVETAVEFATGPRARLVARHLFLDSRVADAGRDGGIEGRRPAQVPGHQFQIGAAFAPADGWEVAVQARGASEQHDDDLNRRTLAGFAAIDLRIGWNPAPGTEIFLACENLLDAEIENGKTASGAVAVAGPRLLRCGFSKKF